MPVLRYSLKAMFYIAKSHLVLFFNPLSVNLWSFPARILLFLLSIISYLSKRKVLIVNNPIGNLGNRLYLHASVLSIAIECKAIYINSALGSWRANFSGTRPGTLAVYPALPLPHISGKIIDFVSLNIFKEAEKLVGNPNNQNKTWATIKLNFVEYFNLDSKIFHEFCAQKQVVFLNGFLFVAPTALHLHQDKVRSYCAQIYDSKNSTIRPLLNLRNDCEIVFGVVVRHGDYREWQNGKYFYGIDCYVTWIHQIEKIFSSSRVGFFICSNNSLDLSSLSQVRYEFRSGNDLENRAVLSLCDYLISPPSTYAGWASFIGNVPVLWLSTDRERIDLSKFKPCMLFDVSDSSFLDCVDVTRSILRI